jgi:hypothetical protein
MKQQRYIVFYYYHFLCNLRLRPAPITRNAASKEESKGGFREIKQGHIDYTVVPNLSQWIVGFQWMQFVLLNAFSCKESSMQEYCVLIRRLSYTNPHLSSPSESKVTTLRKEQVRTCNCAVRLSMFSSRGVLNSLSSCCSVADRLCALSLTKSRAQLGHQYYQKHCRCD